MLLFMCVVVVFATAVKPTNTEFRINKCCQYAEWFDSTQKVCKKLPLDVRHINISEQANPMAWLPGDLGDTAHGGGGGGQMPNCSRREMLLLPTHSRDRYQLHPNGSLTLFSPTARGSYFPTTFHSQEFCVDRTEETQVILMCPCNKINCVNKCCPIGYLKRCSKFKCTCVESDADWKPFHVENALPQDAEDVPYEILEANEPTCPPGKALWIDNPSFKPHHYTNYWWEYPHGYLFSDTDVCGDYVLFDNLPMYQTIGYCYVTFFFEDMFKAGAYVRILPTVLLATTLAVLILAPEKRLSVRGWVHSKSLMCHTGSLLLSNLAIAAYVVYNDDVAYCRTIPFIMYFALVSAAFWLNAICINMAWGFGRPRGPYGESSAARRRVLLAYSAYAWGAALLMTATAAAMWYAPRVPRGWLRPTLMETRSCFWEDKKGAGKLGTLAYFYGPVGFLLLLNASLFLFISVRVRQLRRKTSILTRDTAAPGRARTHKQALLYVRIVWLMGVAEMAVETAAWALHGEGYFFHLAAELIDLLRVVAIFVLCACKRRTWRALRARLCTCTWAGSVRESWSSWRAQQHHQQQQQQHEQAGNGSPTSVTLPSGKTHSLRKEAEELKRRSGESTETLATVCETVETATNDKT